MRRRLKRATLLLLCASLALPPAGVQAALQRKHGGQCLSGDCVNGTGTVSLQDAQYTGAWSNASFVAGTYRVVYAAYPDQRFELDLDANGFPLKGTIQRGWRTDPLRDPTLYTGTFAKVWNPFSRSQVPRYAHGRYTDATGVVYEGDFDFVPGLSSSNLSGGYYIFQGARIDEATDEVRAGLYISDWTTHDVPAGEHPSYLPIVFHRARPDYIAKLQDDLRADLERVNAEEAAKRARERESRENWNTLFATALGVAAVVGVAKLASRSSGSGPSTVSTLGDTLASKQSAPAASSKMVSDLRERAKTDPELARRIGKSSDAELATMLQQAGRTPPPKMTVAEYRGATGKPADTAVAQKQQQQQQQEKAAQELEAKAQAAAAERARKKAEAEAAKRAEQEAEQRAKDDYLRAVASGTRLRARTCPGGEAQYYVVGVRPKIKPAKVSCVDLHYRAQCAGSATYIDGVGKNFTGIATDCYMGDAYRIEPKPACPLEQLNVTVREIRGCDE